MTTENNIPFSEFMSYINSRSVSGIVYNIIDGFHHISFSNQNLVLYNTENESKHTTSSSNKIMIPICEIEHICIKRISKTTDIITLYPFGKMLLLFQ